MAFRWNDAENVGVPPGPREQQGGPARQRWERSARTWAVLAVVCGLAGTAEAVRHHRVELAQPNWTIYHKAEQIFAEVDNIVGSNPSILQMEHLHAMSDEGNYDSDLRVVHASFNDVPSDKKLRVLVDFGEHGREIITSEVALRVLELLVDTARAKDAVGGGSSGETLSELLSYTEFRIVPMENVHGRERVEAGELCLRLNGRDVDTNRNWDIHWGFKEKDYDPKEEYPGLRPFSEPEAQNLKKLAADFAPHVWVNVHSGMSAIFMPYDHKAVIPDTEGARVQEEICRQLNEKSCEGKCAIGSGGKSVGYLAHGTATDYMGLVQNVPLAFTWEIYGDMKADYHDCFRMFNPIGKEEVDKIVRDWSGALFQLLLLVQQHPDIPGMDELRAGAASVRATEATTTELAADAAAAVAEEAAGEVQMQAGTSGTAVTARAHGHAATFDDRNELAQQRMVEHWNAGFALCSLALVSIMILAYSVRGVGTRSGRGGLNRSALMGGSFSRLV